MLGATIGLFGLLAIFPAVDVKIMTRRKDKEFEEFMSKYKLKDGDS